MSQSQPNTTSTAYFQSIFNCALKAYKQKTKKDLATHPLATQLQSCNSASAILAILQGQVHKFDQSRESDKRWEKWLGPMVNVLYAFSATLGEGVGLAFSPAKVIFAGIGVLLIAAKDVNGSKDALASLFERIEHFFKRLETYTEVPPTSAMTDIIIKIMVEVLDILAIATKEMKEGSAKKYLKKLAGRTDIEDALGRLDKLTHDEALMATAQVLKLAHSIDGKVVDIDDKVTNVDDKVTGIDNKVTAIDDNVKIVIDEGKQVKLATNESKRIMQQTADSVDEVKRNQLQQDLRRWLSPPDPSINHNIARATHHSGTASWFFQGSIFNDWKSSGSLLWVHGKPGSGKSILCSTIIQDTEVMCEAGIASMAYFYFDFRDANKQNRHNLLTSLLTQLSTRSNHTYNILSNLYSSHNNGGRQPSDDVLIHCLKSMLSIPNQGPVYIVLDALDECPNTSGMPSPREQVLVLLNELVQSSLPNLHICVTSRPEIDIRSTLQPLTPFQVSLHDQSGQKKDIIEYVSSVIRSDTRMRRWREDDKNLVIETLSERADGMFRWVFCQLETLRYCLPPSVRRILEELPDSLDETYERILNEINKANREHAHRLLQCLTVATRPLRVDELAEVLAIDFSATEGGIPKLNSDWRWDDQEQAVLSTCSSLIAVVDDKGSQVVQFSHFSVKEFLMSSRLGRSSGDASRYHIVLEPAHTILAQACLSVLLRLDDLVDSESFENSFPLAGYAARYWVEHAQFGNVSSRISEGMDDLFDMDKPHFSAWLRIYNIDEGWGNSFDRIDLTEPGPVPLYYSALCGFRDLSEQLIIRNPEHVSAMCGNHKTPLVGALQKAHLWVAELLYEHGANLDIHGKWDRTLLHAASMSGPTETARWLLDHGADSNAVYDDGCAPLRLAAINGHSEIVRMLLQRNARIDSQDNDGRTPLHGASNNGHPDITRVLLEHGADMNIQDRNLETPLHRAAFFGRLEVARVLLEYGANMDLEERDGKTPLQVALGTKYHEVAKLLSEHGAKHG